MSARVGRLKRRADFVRVARARRRWARPGLVLQAAPGDTEGTAGVRSQGLRVGFTATKKIGNAVRRNRAKRRLRAAAQKVMPERAMPGFDYVLIARAATPERAFASLVSDLEAALRGLGVHRAGTAPARAAKP